MKTPDLFPDDRYSPTAERITRPSHPETSGIAAQQLIDSGSLTKHEKIAMRLVRDNPGKTAYELDAIAVAEGMEPDQIRKRLGGLASSERAKLKRGPKRTCSYRKRFGMRHLAHQHIGDLLSAAGLFQCPHLSGRRQLLKHGI